MSREIQVRFCERLWVRFPRATHLLIGFVRREDADAVMCELEKRMAQYGLTLHPDKTRIVAFQKPGPTQKDGKGPGTFDFLGFTAYWRRSRKGTWILALKTRTQRLGRAVQAVKDYCRRHRHKSVEDQRVGLNRRLIGHYNYFGVNGNIRAMAALRYQAERIWHKWLGRRSQRGSIPWEKFGQVLKAHPLARPTIRVQIWGTTS